MTETSRHQQLMNSAYAKFQENKTWTKEEFWKQIGPVELEAVCTGNLNYQVENGGFAQWIANGYCTPETVFVIRRVLTRIGSESAKKVLELIDKVLEIQTKFGSEDRMSEDDFDAYCEALDPLDSDFYKVNRQLLEELETYFRTECN